MSIDRRKLLKFMGLGGFGILLDRLLQPSMAIADDLELETVEANIQKNRTAPLEIRVLNAQGQPLPEQKVKVEQQHLFKFGAAYHRDLSERANESEIDKRDRVNFLRLFNAATITFYWSTYEPQPGVYQDQALLEKIYWLKSKNLRLRGHPLFWNHNPACLPNWLKGQDLANAQIRNLMDKTLSHISSHILPYVEDVDVFNELVYWDIYEHPFTKLMAEEGKLTVATEYLQKFKQLNPQVRAVVNDFSTKPLYFDLLQDLLATGAPIDAIAQQAHMHRGNWSPKFVWEILERLSQLNQPLILSELSVLSGDLKPGLDYSQTYPDWQSHAKGEQKQADYLENFYRLVYSHPQTEGIYLWDYSDRSPWLGAPVGILNKDGSPKPAYERLDRLINQVWRTNGEFITNSQGSVTIPNAYEGKYTVSLDSRAFQGTHSRKQPLKITLNA